MKRAYGYVRSATGETSHLQLQTLRIADYCKDNNFKLVRTFIDSAKSGLKTLQNSALIEMLARCRKKDKIDAVLVTDIDRISRNGVDYFFIKNELRKTDIKLIPINQPQIDDSSEGRCFEEILAGVNLLYKKVSANKRKKDL